MEMSHATFKKISILGTVLAFPASCLITLTSSMLINMSLTKAENARHLISNMKQGKIRRVIFANHMGKTLKRKA